MHDEWLWTLKTNVIVFLLLNDCYNKLDMCVLSFLYFSSKVVKLFSHLILLQCNSRLLIQLCNYYVIYKTSNLDSKIILQFKKKKE